MKFDKIHNKGQARLFNNKFLESLTKAHPLVIWGMYLPIIALMLYFGYAKFEYTVLRIVLMFLGGMLCWSFFEYLAHRYLFHWETKSKWGQKIVYTFHGNHHHYPRDTTRLFMPPVPSIIISGTLFGICYLLLRQQALIFFPGFLFGYLLYGSIHYAIHAWKPPFKWMKPHWRNHHLHHYKNEHMGYGVSSTLWDHVFGTMFDLKNEKEDKEKVKELMYQQKES
ncbi:MAG: sterol desaturase family protein [Chitinophagaceae bacterium]|nr:sterol desaturase family protein [Chitinophagaceae bacterium]MCB0740815.1 sterol desaturase family protein [Chitinophagaceae bacterium]HQV05306.1 sterol desaturase family protein [Chitinophagaceae bacterium]